MKRIISIGFELESNNISPCLIEQRAEIKAIKFHPTDSVLGPGQVRSTDTTLMGITVPFTALEEAAISGEVFLQESESTECLCCQDEIQAQQRLQQAPSEYMLDRSKLRDRRTQYIYHTEFKLTFQKPSRSRNILLSYFMDALDIVQNHYKNMEIIPLNGLDLGKHMYLIEDRDQGDHALAISEDSSRKFRMDHSINWHTQCTIGIKLEDLESIMGYLAVHSDYDYGRVVDIHQGYPVNSGHQETEFEYNMYFLMAMYEHAASAKLGKSSDARDFKFAVRHPFKEIVDYYLQDEWDGENVNDFKDVDLDMAFRDVTTFPYKGVILLEIRDFYDQLLMSGLKARETQYPDGMSIESLRSAVKNIRDGTK